MLSFLITKLKISSKSKTFSLNNCFIVFILSIITLNITAINGDIAVISTSNRTVDVFVDFELTFAASVPSEGLLGRLVVGSPEDGCAKMTGPPRTNQTSALKWFVLVRRYPCQFSTKVENARNAGFDAVIIYNIDVTAVKKYTLSHSQIESGVSIPALLISFDDGWTLKREYMWSQGFLLLILPDLPFNLNAYLLPFAIVIGVCLLLMISFMVFQIVKCIRDRKRRLRHRLSSKHLKQIPIQKFKKGDQYDTCAICLDEYVEGEKLRILPCGHAYHVKCIDPWLTKNRRVCPVCKGKVVLPGMSDISDTESESEHHNNTGANERTPLLFTDRTQSRRSRTDRNSRRRRRSYPQTSNATSDQTSPPTQEQSAESPAETVSGSAPNVRVRLYMVEADITPMLAPTHLSVNCDSEESVIEVTEEAPLPSGSTSRVEAKGLKSRRQERQDVIV